MGWRELARMGFSFLSFFFPFEKKAAVFFSCDGGESFPERENAPEETIYSQHTQRKQTNKRTNKRKERKCRRYSLDRNFSSLATGFRKTFARTVGKIATVDRWRFRWETIERRRRRKGVIKKRKRSRGRSGKRAFDSGEGRATVTATGRRRWCAR